MSEASDLPEFPILPTAEPDENGLFTRRVVMLPNVVLLPGTITTLSQLMPAAREAMDAAHRAHETVLFVPQRAGFTAEELIGSIATEASVGRLFRLPDGGITGLVRGYRRVEIEEIVQEQPHLLVRARALSQRVPATRETTAMSQAVVNLFRRVAELNDTVTDDVLFHVMNNDDPGLLADLVTATLSVSFDERLRVLNTTDPDERLHHVAVLLGQELSMLELKDEITHQIQQEMDREQREVYLREQMRVIQTELGEEDFFQQELNEVRDQIARAALPAEVHEKAVKELSRLSVMSPMAPEVGMVRTYIDWLTEVPWNRISDDKLDLASAKTVLDAEHFGLPKVKDRILEYIAVQKLAANKGTSPILCLVGPPGVGKTSLGKSIARALGREFVRVSLGGVRDEAEIRGHRRTYVGALPGRIIQTMRRAGTLNPVFMLDEIDKLGADFRGDPSAALLEVLDPEQNFSFFDHYLDVPYDLSKVFFITTANDLEPLPPALLDRLEIIELSGYTEEEKIAIARRFLIPRQIEGHGLSEIGLAFETAALQVLIREYTYEAGVRNLEREIANLCRKVARMLAEGKRRPPRISPSHVYRLLGPPYFDELFLNDKDEVGVATGVAWTPVGGDVLIIEAVVLPGKGNLTLTGSLGDVMQESAQAALSYMRMLADDLQVPHDDFDNLDVHIHLPEGAVPKEGPSAGITLAIAIISAFTDRKVRSDTALTGEITLRGKILPVGGVKEKVLAARRARLRQIILPKQNERDLVDVPQEALADLKIVLVSDMREVLDQVLLDGPPVDERRIDRLRREGEREDEEAEGSDES